MQDVLQHQDFTKFHSLKPHLLDIVDNMLAKDIARLMEMIPQEEMTMVVDPVVKGKSLPPAAPLCRIRHLLHLLSTQKRGNHSSSGDIEKFLGFPRAFRWRFRFPIALKYCACAARKIPQLTQIFAKPKCEENEFCQAEWSERLGFRYYG